MGGLGYGVWGFRVVKFFYPLRGLGLSVIRTDRA